MSALVNKHVLEDLCLEGWMMPIQHVCPGKQTYAGTPLFRRVWMKPIQHVSPGKQTCAGTPLFRRVDDAHSACQPW